MYNPSQVTILSTLSATFEGRQFFVRNHFTPSKGKLKTK